MHHEPVDWSSKISSHVSLYADYYGLHADKYLRAQEFFKINPSRIYWNWSAAILGPIWLFYRKLYIPLFIWLLIGVPFDFLYFAAPRIDPSLKNPFMAIIVNHYIIISGAFVVASGLLLGCWGTYYYLQQSAQIVNMAKAKTPHRIAATILTENGNPSYWRAVMGTILIAGIYILTILLANLWIATT